MPTGNALTTSEWSTIVLHAKVWLILEVWRYSNSGAFVSVNGNTIDIHCCLLNRLFRRRSKKTSKLRVTGLCAGIHQWSVNSPHKWRVTRKTFPFDDVIISRELIGKKMIFILGSYLPSATSGCVAGRNFVIIHNNAVTRTSWRLKWPDIQLFVQQLVRV